MSIIVGLTGFKRSGKDTAGAFFAEALKDGAYLGAYADPLKQYAYDLDPLVFWLGHDPIFLRDAVDELGWEKAKDVYPQVRRTLQRLGTEVFRMNVGEHYWTELMDNRVGLAVKSGHNFIVTDCRFQNELDLVKSWHLPHVGTGTRAITIRVNRDDVTPDPESAHVSELNIPNLEVDMDIDNNGTLEDLRIAVRQIVKSLEDRES